MRCFARVLKTAPTAHVVDQYRAKFQLALDYIFQQLLESVSILEPQPTSCGVRVSLHDLKSLFCCISAPEQVSDDLTTRKAVLLETDLHPELSLARSAKTEQAWSLAGPEMIKVTKRRRIAVHSIAPSA